MQTVVEQNRRLRFARKIRPAGLDNRSDIFFAGSGKKMELHLKRQHDRLVLGHDDRMLELRRDRIVRRA